MKNNRGAAMMLALVTLAIMGIGVTATLTWFHSTYKYATLQEARQTCSHIAEAGLDKALAELQSGNKAYSGETNVAIGDGSFTVAVKPAGRAGWVAIDSTGTLPRGASVVTVRLREEVQLDPAGKIVAMEWQEVRHE
jgi:Tfp pilus assembly protein PilX